MLAEFPSLKEMKSFRKKSEKKLKWEGKKETGKQGKFRKREKKASL